MGGVHTFNEQLTVAIGSSTNLNDCLDENTKYYITGQYRPINSPVSGAHNAVVWNKVYAGGVYRVQFYASYNLNCIWYRTAELSTWNAWRSTVPNITGVSVTADGVKTYGTLLNELFALIDSTKITMDSKVVISGSIFTISYIGSEYHFVQSGFGSGGQGLYSWIGRIRIANNLSTFFE